MQFICKFFVFAFFFLFPLFSAIAAYSFMTGWMDCLNWKCESYFTGQASVAHQQCEQRDVLQNKLDQSYIYIYIYIQSVQHATCFLWQLHWHFDRLRWFASQFTDWTGWANLALCTLFQRTNVGARIAVVYFGDHDQVWRGMVASVCCCCVFAFNNFNGNICICHFLCTFLY